MNAILDNTLYATSDGNIPFAVVMSVLPYAVPSEFNAFNESDVAT